MDVYPPIIHKLNLKEKQWTVEIIYAGGGKVIQEW